MHKNPSKDCQTCREKLLNCDIRIVTFVRLIQEAFADCHVAIGYRDQADQHQAKVHGLSTFDWPESKHNNTVNGHSCSLAVDLFQLGPDGKAYFRVPYYETIWKYYQDNKDLFEHGPQSDLCLYNWGGTWVHLKDFDHFEVVS